MPSIEKDLPATLARSERTKKINALAAILCGGLPALGFGIQHHGKPIDYLLGFLIGILWANGFEYFYHRILLHKPWSYFARRHLVHHMTTGTAEETEQLTFGESPSWIVLLFVVNGAPAVAADLFFGLPVAPGILAAFAVYFVAVEEIHWRIHLGGYLPPVLRPATEYHLIHHKRPDGRFNVFLPIFDWLLGTAGGPVLVARPNSGSFN